MATHSSVLAWRIQGRGSLVGCHLWGRTESDTTEATQQQQQYVHGRPTCRHNVYSSQISCQYFQRKLTYKRTTYLSSSSVLFSLGRGRSLPINFRSLQSVKALESCVLLRHFGVYLHFSFLGLISLILHEVSEENLGKVRRRPEE